MAVTSKWRHHIERWQSSGLTQADYSVQQQINARTAKRRRTFSTKRRVGKFININKYNHLTIRHEKCKGRF